MRYFLLFLTGLFLTIAPAALAEPQTDVAIFRSCRLCGMDRGNFSHSRMLVEYEDGSSIGTCSLHCTAVELANTIDRIPVLVKVADYDSKVLIDVEKAVWVMGGSRKGVMTGQPKWAFASSAAADRFIKSHGGNRVGFDDAIKAAYDDMYQDTKIIREFRKMKQQQQNDGTAAE